jgi:hypothetical protein
MGDMKVFLFIVLAFASMSLFLRGGEGSQVSSHIPFEDSPFGISAPGKDPMDRWENFITLLEDLNIHWVGAQSRTNGLSWGDVQKRKDSPYDWGETDNTIRSLQSKDINFFTILYPLATWDLYSKYSKNELKIRPSGFPVSRLPVDLEAYSRFIEAAVERYDGDGNADMPGLKFPVRYWMSIAEPDNPGDWDDTPENYAVLIKIMYKAIKKADPNGKLVIHGANGIIGEGANAYEKMGFFHRVFVKLKEIAPTEKYKNFIWGFHYVTNAGTYLMSENLIKSMNNITKDFGYGLYPIWVTETGTFSGDFFIWRKEGRLLQQTDRERQPFLKYRGERRPIPQAGKEGGPFTRQAEARSSPQTESEQAGELVKGFVFNTARGAKKVFWVRLVDSSFEKGPFKGVGLVTLEGRKKLSYYTLKFMINKMENCDWGKTETLISGVGGVHAYKFVKKDKVLYVAWQDNNKGDAKTLTLNIRGAPSVRVTSFVPESPDSFKTDIIPAGKNQVTIPLGKDPVLIEEIIP